MDKNIKKITLMIPCYNEEKGIGKVIDGIPLEKLKQHGFKIEVLVIDNNCTDKTHNIAKAKGARIICETQQGKGNAIRTGFRNIPKDVDYVVMIDGDDTYKTSEILRLIEPLESGFSDVILGSRLEGKMISNSMSLSHRMANWLFTFITRRLYNNANITDTCTGYFAWKRHVIVNLNGYITSPGFAIESEMITKMARLGHKLYSVPITYDPRSGETKNRQATKDALKIIMMLIRNAKWKPKEE